MKIKEGYEYILEETGQDLSDSGWLEDVTEGRPDIEDVVETESDNYIKVWKEHYEKEH